VVLNIEVVRQGMPGLSRVIVARDHASSTLQSPGMAASPRVWPLILLMSFRSAVQHRGFLIWGDIPCALHLRAAARATFECPASPRGQSNPLNPESCIKSYTVLTG
jgi:hypothetical protein